MRIFRLSCRFSGIVIAFAHRQAAIHGREGIFLWSISSLMILLCLFAARFLSSLDSWPVTGPTLLFLPFLTFLNAPFDWGSLGLTRALLRRGLRLEGLYPAIFAVTDAVLSVVIVILLALTMIVGVQTFNLFSQHGGSLSVLSLDTLFNELAAHPTAPEYFWIYALLLSTMIPSVVNLTIGATSLFRGIPGLSRLLLKSMPAGRRVPLYNRWWIGFLLAFQWVIGALLAVAAHVGLIAIIFYGPYFIPRLGLLDIARTVADFNVPARVEELIQTWRGLTPAPGVFKSLR